jgi:hypothetical protein
LFAIRQIVGENICKGGGKHKLGVILLKRMEEGRNLYSSTPPDEREPRGLCRAPASVEIYTLITTLGLRYITLDTVISAVCGIKHSAFRKLALPLSSGS